MGIDVVQSLHAIDRFRSGTVKPALALEVGELSPVKLDRNTRAPTDLTAREEPAEQFISELRKRPYPAPTETPTQQGPKGLRFDFNDGCRVLLPESTHPWRARMSDLDTGNVLFATELKGGRINSTKRYFVRFRLEIWQGGESVLRHDYSAKDREVLIQFPVGTLGDPMGWFPYAVKFQERHGCKLTCALGDKLIAL